MSVDTVNEALTTVRLGIIGSSDAFSREAYVSLLNSCEYMRFHLMREDIDAFDNYVDRLLADRPDRADYILTELFMRLGIDDRYQLSEILQQP